MADQKCELPDYNPPSAQVIDILQNYRKIAIVGISPKETRDSNRVARYLIEQGYEITPVTAKAVKIIDYDVRLKKDQISSILVTGIPMMIVVAADDAQISDLLFEESRKKDRSKAKHRKFARKDYFNIFGKAGHTINRAVIAETEAKEGDINDVMALFLPTFVDVIEEENPLDVEALTELFRTDAEEIRSDNFMAVGLES